MQQLDNGTQICQCPNSSICECVTIHIKRDFVDMAKLEILKTGDYLVCQMDPISEQAGRTSPLRGSENGSTD
jgi:hypothetical protein